MDPTQNNWPALASAETTSASQRGASRASSVRLVGIGASPGVAVGPALIVRTCDADRAPEQALSTRSTQADGTVERGRLHAALVAAAADLRAMAERVAREIGPSEAGIFESQALMLEDPSLSERASDLIEREGTTAIAALNLATEEQAALLSALPGPLWQARAADVRDAARRALSHLQAPGRPAPTLQRRLAEAKTPVVVVVEDLAPSDTVGMRAEQVLAIALVRGSATAHAAILARALGIPAVVGLGQTLFERVDEEDVLVVDGAHGAVLVRPSTTERERAAQEADQHRSSRAARRTGATQRHALPGRTRDGQPVPLLANVGTEADARAAAEMGAEGIGLLRTEFLLSGRATLPDVYEQAELYTAIVDALGPVQGPIIVRTLDAGADKPLPALAPFLPELRSEANPALGLRGIRLQLAGADLLATQLRALLMTAARTQANLRIMLPMVAIVDEVREARAQLREARTALIASGVPLDRAAPLGIMVETPAAVLSIEALARETTFFSIGTNDLTQYVMAADRLNPQLASLCQPTQPAVLHAIATVAREARRVGRHVGVCGEMAGDARLGPLLVGLGVSELSMNPTSIPSVKEALAARTSEELRALAERVLQAVTRHEVERLLAEFYG